MQANENPVKLKRRLLPVNEAAEYLGLAPKTLRNRLGPKAPDPFPVKPRKIGKKVLFDVHDLDRFCDSLADRSAT